MIELQINSDAYETVFTKFIKTIGNFAISNPVLSSFLLNIGTHSFQNDHSQSSSTIFLFLHLRTSVTNDFSFVSFLLFSSLCCLFTTDLPRKALKRASTRGYCVRRRRCVRSAAARVAMPNTRAPKLRE